MGPAYTREPPPPTLPRDALKGKRPQRRPQKRLDRRLEEVSEAVWGGYCRLQVPLSPAPAVMKTVAGHRLDALEAGGGGLPLAMHPCPPPPRPRAHAVLPPLHATAQLLPFGFWPLTLQNLLFCPAALPPPPPPNQILVGDHYPFSGGGFGVLA